MQQEDSMLLCFSCCTQVHAHVHQHSSLQAQHSAPSCTASSSSIRWAHSSGGSQAKYLQIGLVHVDDRHPARAQCLGRHGGDEA